MKRIKLFLFLLGIAFTIAQAQITTMSIPEQQEAKAYVYDSLSNIKVREDGYNYLKGQKIYLATSNMYMMQSFTQISNGVERYLEPKDLVGKYFQVIDVRKRDSRKELRDPLILVQENTTDTICYVGNWSDNTYWIVVGYFEKVKSYYEGKVFYFMQDDPGYKDADGLIDMKTQKRRRGIPKESKWTCKAVSINQEPDPYLNIKGSRLVLILENDSLGEHYCYYENSYAALSIFNNYLFGKFLSDSDYERMKKDEANRKAELIRKYGKERGKMISEGYIKIGMTKNMCIDAWGGPQKINKTTGSYGVHEQWVYGLNSYVYFQNGVITTIQN